MTDALPPRRWLARGLAALVVLSLLTPAGAAAVRGGPNGQYPELRPGTIESPANGTTVVSIQGFHFQGEEDKKKPARLVAVGPNGRTDWVFDGSEYGASWFYDVDPLPNGNLLVVSTNPPDRPPPGGTMVFELDPERREIVWREHLPYHDTHDVDMLADGRLVVANMRNWDAENGTSNDRVLVYNRTTDEVEWEWYVKNHYPADTDGGMNPDWSHVNDVDPIGDDRLLVSPRNFDQAIVINRTTKEIETRLGADGEKETLFEQHNPDYLVSGNGTPAILVADSENDRVVEYAREDGEWVRTWEVGTGQLNWPRDADRLPNGNTLIVDSINHRVIEVTPEGEIVWEYYATWAPYDAERVVHGDGSSGPTIRELNASGTYQLSGSAGLRPGTGDTRTFAGWLTATASGTPLAGPVTELARTWSHVTPWIRPAWLGSWGFAFAALGLLVLLGWGVAEAVYQRRRIADGLRGLARGVA